jgi:hypothetical protein
MAIDGNPASHSIQAFTIQAVRLAAGEPEVFLKEPANIA